MPEYGILGFMAATLLRSSLLRTLATQAKAQTNAFAPRYKTSDFKSDTQSVEMLKDLCVGVVLISLGSLLIGLGEWIQHPKRDQFIPASYLNPNLVITIHERKTTLLGSLFDILGFVILVIGIAKIFNY